jgi:hypothetical protein
VRRNRSSRIRLYGSGRTFAKEATIAQSKETLQNLAQSWTRLAAELEAAQALLNALNGMELKNAPSDEADQHEEAT